MPYKDVWVKPDIFMRYKGITFYYTYRYNNVNDRVSEYHFTTNKFDTDYKEPGDGFVFDVRELETWEEPPRPPNMTGAMSNEESKHRKKLWDQWREDRVEEKAVKKAIKLAVDKGLYVDEIMRMKSNDGV